MNALNGESGTQAGRKHQIKFVYDLCYEDYKLMYTRQHGKCCICKKSIALYKNDEGIEVACVDHDHVTGDVRGLLCRMCNSALGFMRDDVQALERAAEYLKKSNG